MVSVYYSHNAQIDVHPWSEVMYLWTPTAGEQQCGGGVGFCLIPGFFVFLGASGWSLDILFYSIIPWPDQAGLLLWFYKPWYKFAGLFTTFTSCTFWALRPCRDGKLNEDYNWPASTALPFTLQVVCWICSLAGNGWKAGSSCGRAQEGGQDQWKGQSRRQAKHRGTRGRWGEAWLARWVGSAAMIGKSHCGIWKHTTTSYWGWPLVHLPWYWLH